MRCIIGIGGDATCLRRLPELHRTLRVMASSWDANLYFLVKILSGQVKDRNRKGENAGPRALIYGSQTFERDGINAISPPSGYISVLLDPP